MVIPTKFATAWGAEQALKSYLFTLVTASILLNLLLGGLIAWHVVQGMPVYFVSPGGPGVTQPGMIPDAFATDYASRCVQTRYTFTPSTLKAAHAAFLPCLHPTLTVEFDARTKKEVPMVKEAQLGTQLITLEASVKRRSSEGITVGLTGIRTVWIGGQQVREEPVQADLTLVPWLAQGRPQGVVIREMKITPALSVSGG